MQWMRKLDNEVVLKVDVEGLEGTCKGGLQRAQAVTTIYMHFGFQYSACSTFLQLLRRAARRADEDVIETTSIFGTTRSAVKRGWRMRASSRIVTSTYRLQ